MENAYTYDGRDIWAEEIWICDLCGERVATVDLYAHLEVEHEHDIKVAG